MANEADEGVAHKKIFLAKLIKLFEENLKNERITVPLMKTLEMLMSSDYLSHNDLSAQMSDIHALTVKECNKSKNMGKLISAVGLFSSFLSFNDDQLVKKGTKTLLYMLYHNFPKVRVVAAEKLYTALLVVEDQSLVHDKEEDIEKAVEVLSETDWTQDLKKLPLTKGEMYALFGHTYVPPAKAEGGAEKPKSIAQKTKEYDLRHAPQ